VTRALALAALAVAVLAVGGCSTLTVEPGLTADEATTQTGALVDDAVSAIDESTIERVDQVKDESAPCYSPQADSDGSIVYWENRQYVWLVDGADPLDELDGVVEQLVDAGARLTYDSESEGTREVQLSSGGDSLPVYIVSVSAAPAGSAPAVINVSATSPCFETK